MDRVESDGTGRDVTRLAASARRLRERRRLLVAVLVGLVITITAGCVTNPVGPVTSFEAYREKASRSVDVAISSVETVRIAGDGELHGQTFTAYASQVMDDSLDELRSAQDTFEGIAAPDDRSRALGASVLDELEASRRSIVEVIGAIDAHDPVALTARVQELEAVSTRLHELQGELDGATS